jgi:transcriptional regulator
MTHCNKGLSADIKMCKNNKKTLKLGRDYMSSVVKSIKFHCSTSDTNTVLLIPSKLFQEARHAYINVIFKFLKIMHHVQTSKSKKNKAVPLHAMVAHGGRGGIASTHT